MTELDDQILSFIVKIWLEEEEPISKPSWQGTITHVPSGKRKSIHNIHGIEKFIQSFIESTPLHSDNSHPTT